MPYANDTLYPSKDDYNMEAWRLRPGETNLEVEAAFAESRVHYENQQAVQLLLLRMFKLCEELILNCDMKYLFENSSARYFYKKRTRRGAERFVCMRAKTVA